MIQHYRRLCLTILASLTLSGCGHTNVIQIPDFTVYGDKGDIGCTAVHTLAAIPPKDISAEDCAPLLIGTIAVNAADFATIQSNVDKMCTTFTGACTYEMVMALSRLKKLNSGIIKFRGLNELNFKTH